jgi:hypothetical protein
VRLPLILLLLAGCGSAGPPDEFAPLADPSTGEEVPTPPQPLEVVTAKPDPMPEPEPESVAPEPETKIARPIQGVVLPTPPFKHTLVKSVEGVPDAGPPRLKPLSRKRNKITDDEDWFRALDAAVPRPPTHLIVDDHELTIVSTATNGPPDLVLDFRAYSYAPAGPERERRFVNQRLTWVEILDGVLYVSHGHRTYAESSGGMNAYITAIDLESRKLLWRSAPLVAGSRNFVIRGGYIITGYGFTDERDFLFVLDRATGEIVRRKKLASAPDYFIVRDGVLHVRCYDTDYVFRLIE